MHGGSCWVGREERKKYAGGRADQRFSTKRPAWRSRLLHESGGSRAPLPAGRLQRCVKIRSKSQFRARAAWPWAQAYRRAVPLWRAAAARARASPAPRRRCTLKGARAPHLSLQFAGESMLRRFAARRRWMPGAGRWRKCTGLHCRRGRADRGMAVAAGSEHFRLADRQRSSVLLARGTLSDTRRHACRVGSGAERHACRVGSGAERHACPKAQPQLASQGVHRLPL